MNSHSDQLADTGQALACPACCFEWYSRAFNEWAVFPWDELDHTCPKCGATHTVSEWLVTAKAIGADRADSDQGAGDRAGAGAVARGPYIDRSVPIDPVAAALPEWFRSLRLRSVVEFVVQAAFVAAVTVLAVLVLEWAFGS